MWFINQLITGGHHPAGGNSGQFLFFFVFGHASGTHGLPENQPAIVDVHGQLGDFPTKGISNIPLYSHYTTIVTPLCVW